MKIKKHLILYALLFGITSVSFALEKPTSYRLPITRDKVKTQRLSFNFWNGEYPGPIIDVHSQTKGTTTINGFKSLRTLDQPKSCSINNGLYHPWSTTSNSVINYYSLTEIVEYDIIEGSYFKISIKQMPARLIDVIYLAEGSCSGKGISGKTKKNIVFTCSDLDNKKLAIKTSKEMKFNEQWLQLKCQGGGEIFIKDTELLTVAGVKEGTLISYGKVGPAKTD